MSFDPHQEMFPLMGRENRKKKIEKMLSVLPSPQSLPCP